jgi:hypothetical protein
MRLEDHTLDDRVAALERAVADLQCRITSSPPSNCSLDQFAGSISDEAAFMEALELGRAARDADRPAGNAAGQS